MKGLSKGLAVFALGVCLVGCGGEEKKEAGGLKPGQMYVMTEKGLEPVLRMKDRDGNDLVTGKEYVMTPAGLEPVQFLRDHKGKRVQVGDDYMMTPNGLKPVASRSIRGVVADNAGKPLSGVNVSIADTDYKSVTDASGAFGLPFMEGFVNLAVSVPSLPGWCRANEASSSNLSRAANPEGWDAGVIHVSCAAAGTKDGKIQWATSDGAFRDNGDGTVTDIRNNLLWETRMSLPSASWTDAGQHAKDLSLGGLTGWRLPTVQELTALAESQRACEWYGPAVIGGAISVWSSEQAGEASAVVVNLCSGKERRSVGFDEGGNLNPGVLAVRSLTRQ